MTIDLLPDRYFGGGRLLAVNDPRGLRQILNEMITAINASTNLGYYAYMGLGAADQSSIDVGDHVEWDTSSISGSLISLSTGVGQANGIISLAADHIYKISYGLDVELDSPEIAIFAAYDRTQSATLVPVASATSPKVRCRAVGDTGGGCGMAVSSFLFEPSVATDFDIRVESVSGGGTVDVLYNFSWLTIDVMS